MRFTHSFIDRPISTFEAEHYVVRPNDVARISVPLKASVTEFMDGQIIVQLSQDWTAGTTTIGAGHTGDAFGTLLAIKRLRKSPALGFIKKPATFLLLPGEKVPRSGG